MSPIRTLAAALALSAALPASAAAAPGLTAPALIAQHAGCVSLAGALIAWSEPRGPLHHREDSLGHLAELLPSGTSGETSFDSGTVFPGCPAPAAAQSTGAEILARPPHAAPSLRALANEPLWLARPGGALTPSAWPASTRRSRWRPTAAA